MRGALPELRRQYVVAVLAFAGLLLGTFVLFAHLLTSQFSRSYLEDVLLSGRAQAEELASQMKGEGPLYKVVESRRVALAKVSAALAHQEVIDSVRVLDERGKLVWQTVTRAEGYTGGFPEGNLELAAPPTEPEVRETSNSYLIRVPLEDLGTVVYSLSKQAVAGRIAILQRRLLLNTAVAAGVGLSVLAAAVLFIWHLVQRNAVLETRKRLDEDMAALGSLAANLAHEIRNPLNALSINLETAGGGPRFAGVGCRQRRARPPRGRPAVPVGQRLPGLRASRLAGRRGLRRQGSPRGRRPAARGPPASAPASMLTIETSPATALADRGQISQVLVNLALNAVQAMESSQARSLLLKCREENGRVTFEVIDSGPGIPEAELERVREAFYSRRKGGTGLGLAIAERIVGGHGGTLELTNRPEGGLTARVTVPAAGRVEGLKRLKG